MTKADAVASTIAPEPGQLTRMVILSSSLLTERIIYYTDFLNSLGEQVQIDLWTTAAGQPDSVMPEKRSNFTVSPFPAVAPFRDFPYNLLRRLNEFAWDYRLRTPSRFGAMKRIRDRETKLYTRALRAPALAMAALGLEERFEEWLQGILMRYPRSPEGATRLAESNPDLLLTTGNFRFEEPAIAVEARRRGIPTLAFITSWDNPSTKNRMIVPDDGYLVWSEQMKNDMHTFFPQTKTVPIYVVGAPQFDVFFQPRFEQSRESFCMRHGLNPSLPIILYALGSPNLFQEYPTVLHLARSINGADLGPAQLLIRPHPLHDRGLDLNELRGMGERIVVQETGQRGLSVQNRTQNEEQILDWVNTFRHAAVVVNLSSTAAIDGAIFDKPIVNLDYDPGEGRTRQDLVKEVNHAWTHFKPVAESGGLWLVESPQEMVAAVRAYLQNPALHTEERARMVSLVCGYADGRCGQRMARAVIDFRGRRDS